MRSLTGFSLALLLATTVLSAQNRSGFVNTPGVTRAFGSVVFPGGTSALPGVQRTTGSVVNPGGGTQIGVPGIPLQTPITNPFRGFNVHQGLGAPAPVRVGRQGGFGRPGGGGRNGDNRGGVVYAYPVFVGGGGYYGGDAYDNGYETPAVQPEMQQQQQQPSIMIIFPPNSATPTTLYPSEPGSGAQQPAAPNSLYEPQASQPSADEATHYLIAFKDHTIYSAVAYWVDGDTLHYFTSGNTHNQASLSLVDRALTDKLNQDSGLQVKLPPAK